MALSLHEVLPNRKDRRAFVREQRNVDHRNTKVPTVKLDMQKEMLDAKKEPVKFADQSTLLLRDLIFRALEDEPPPPSMPGQPPQPPVTVSKEDKRKRWRLSVAVYTNDVLELDKGDKEYILERAEVMLSSPGFGMLEDAIDEAEIAAARAEPDGDAEPEQLDDDSDGAEA